MNKVLKIIIITIIYLYIPIDIHSQISDSNDKLKKNSTVNTLSSSFLGGITYYSNTNFLGIYSLNIVQPSLSPTISYFGKSGIIATISPMLIYNADLTFNNTATEIDLQAGYRWDLSSLFSLTPTYVHFLYSNNMNLYRSSFSDYFGLTYTAQSNWFTCNLIPAYALGSQNEFLIESQTGLNISLDKLFGKNQLLLIQPSVNVTFNDQYYYRRFDFLYFGFLQTYDNMYPRSTIGDFRTYLVDHPLDTWVKGVEKYLDTHPKINKAYTNLKPKTSIDQLFAVNTKFNLSYIEIPLMVTWSYKGIVARLSTSIYRPVNAPSYIQNQWNIMYSAGLYYMFSW